MKKYVYLFSALLLLASCSQDGNQQAVSATGSDPLPSWNETAAKKAIIDFVTQATTEGGTSFIPVSERIATFDNDGTLWCEHPLYFEMVYSVDAAKKILAAHPELAKNPKLSALTSKEAFAKNPEAGILEAFALSHAGMSSDAFAQQATVWLDTATHSRFKVKYTQLIYQPMVELLQYLRDNNFKTYIVSGGSSAFIRLFSDSAYGIPAEQVIGTMLKAQFVAKDGKYEVVTTTDVWHNDDKDGKPVGIQQIIGKKPVLAFGNSDGDLQMLQWTSSNTRPNLCLILHHTDADREYAYDSLSTVGTLKNALTEGKQKGWTIVDMKNDFKTVFAFQNTAK